MKHNGIVHTYFTDGYFEWGKFFIETFKHFNDPDRNILVVSTRNLKKDQIDELMGMYPNITVNNKKLKYGEMAKRAKVDKVTLLRMKSEVENVKVNSNNKVWKLMIAAEDRLLEILDVLQTIRPLTMLHVDVDTYVRGDVTPIFDVIKQNTFTTRWRIEKQMKRDGYIKHENRATLISVQGYNGARSIDFLRKWLDHLLSVKPHSRPTGFGQSTCYRAYLDFQDDKHHSWGDVPPEFLSPQGYGKGILWGANKGTKKDTLMKYKKHFKENK